MFPENPRNGNGQLLDLDFNMEILHSVRLAKYTRGNLNYLNLKNSTVTFASSTLKIRFKSIDLLPSNRKIAAYPSVASCFSIMYQIWLLRIPVEIWHVSAMRFSPASSPMIDRGSHTRL
jgi:hypothetical protein